MSKPKGFLAAYHTTLTQAGAENITIRVTRDRPGATIRVRLNGRTASHHIQQSILRQGTAEQGEEAARAVLKELGCPNM
jgi:hypothetical protein